MCLSSFFFVLFLISLFLIVCFRYLFGSGRFRNLDEGLVHFPRISSLSSISFYHYFCYFPDFVFIIIISSFYLLNSGSLSIFFLTYFPSHFSSSIFFLFLLRYFFCLYIFFIVSPLLVFLYKSSSSSSLIQLLNLSLVSPNYPAFNSTIVKKNGIKIIR